MFQENRREKKNFIPNSERDASLRRALKSPVRRTGTYTRVDSIHRCERRKREARGVPLRSRVSLDSV